MIRRDFASTFSIPISQGINNLWHVFIMLYTTNVLILCTTRVAYARISHGGLSDTEMQIGKFMISSPPFVEDWKYVTTDPKEVPSWMHFPSK